MDVSATLAEIASLPVDDRIHLVEAIWENIVAEPDQPRLSDARKQLDRRLAAHAAFSGKRRTVGACGRPRHWQGCGNESARRLAVGGEAQFDEAFDWYERQRPGLGRDLAACVGQAFDRIAQTPELGGKVFRHVAVRRCIAFRTRCITRWRRIKSSSSRYFTANGMQKCTGSRLQDRHIARFQTEVAHGGLATAAAGVNRLTADPLGRGNDLGAGRRPYDGPGGPAATAVA